MAQNLRDWEIPGYHESAVLEGGLQGALHGTPDTIYVKFKRL